MRTGRPSCATHRFRPSRRMSYDVSWGEGARRGPAFPATNHPSLRRLVGQRFAPLDRLLHVFGTTGPGRLVGDFERRRDVAVRVQVRWHIRQPVADADRLDV